MVGKEEESSKKIRNYPGDYVVRVCTIEHTLHLPELLAAHSQRPTSHLIIHPIFIRPLLPLPIVCVCHNARA